MYSFNDWLKIEAVGRKAVQAARVFADGETAKHLGYLEHVLAEMRHAAGQLGEAHDRLAVSEVVMEQDDALAIQRLRDELFKRPVPPRRSDNNPERRAEDGYVGA